MSNINTGRHLPRRTVLRGLGAAVALPLLDSMVPALSATRATAAARVRRFGAIYVGMGMNMPVWNQPEVGKPLAFNPILAPIETFKDRILVVSGCHNERGEGLDGGAHPRVQTYWMTGCRANRSEGGDLRAGTSLDQIIARQWETETQLGLARAGDRADPPGPAPAPSAIAAPTTTRSSGARRPPRCRWRTTRATCSSGCSAPATAQSAKSGCRTSGPTAACSTR